MAFGKHGVVANGVGEFATHNHNVHTAEGSGGVIASAQYSRQTRGIHGQRAVEIDILEVQAGDVGAGGSNAAIDDAVGDGHNAICVSGGDIACGGEATEVDGGGFADGVITGGEVTNHIEGVKLVHKCRGTLQTAEIYSVVRVGDILHVAVGIHGACIARHAGGHALCIDVQTGHRGLRYRHAEGAAADVHLCKGGLAVVAQGDDGGCAFGVEGTVCGHQVAVAIDGDHRCGGRVVETVNDECGIVVDTEVVAGIGIDVAVAPGHHVAASNAEEVARCGGLADKGQTHLVDIDTAVDDY